MLWNLQLISSSALKHLDQLNDIEVSDFICRLQMNQNLHANSRSGFLHAYCSKNVVSSIEPVYWLILGVSLAHIFQVVVVKRPSIMAMTTIALAWKHCSQARRHTILRSSAVHCCVCQLLLKRALHARF